MKPSRTLIVSLYRQFPQLFRSAPEEDWCIAPLGQGENHTNYVITLRDNPVYCLRAGKSEKDSKSLQYEFDILAKVPEGLAPDPLVIDVSMHVLPLPYLILSYCPGELVEEWHTERLCRFAGTVAKMHQKHYEWPTAIDEKPGPYTRFKSDWLYWTKQTPEIVQNNWVITIKNAIEPVLKASDAVFQALPYCHLVHGDIHRFNVVLEKQRFRFIDWEFAAFGDGAADLVKLAWPVETHWQVKIEAEQWRQMLGAWQSVNPDTTLEVRCDAWLLFFMFFDFLYHSTQISDSPDCIQRKTAAAIKAWLSARFIP